MRRGAGRRRARIGIDDPDAAVGENPAELAPEVPVTSYPRVGWGEVLTDRPEQEPILDVRRAEEYEASHIAGAVHIPLHELMTRMDEVPAGRLWVHCGSGYRSGVAASLLERAGKDPVHIDAMFDEAADAGLPMDS